MIRVSEPLVGNLEIKRVSNAIKSGYVSSSSPGVIKFEKQWAKYCGRKYGVSLTNGTVALELAIKILGLKNKDEIIMPSNTIISCAMAAVYNNLKIVPVDCHFDNWCIDENKIEKKITKRTKAILFVNIFGHPSNIDKLKKLAKKYKLYLIEDAAESHGSKYKGKKCGSFGDISTFSFYANKLITTGEGGMLLTNNKKFFEKAKYFRNLCFEKKDRFKHFNLGYNLRMSNLQAEVGIAQIKRINFFIKKKINMAKFYNKSFKNISMLQLPKTEKWAFNTFWMYGVLIKNKKVTAKYFMKELKKYGIESRPFFYGIHMQPALKGHLKHKNDLKNTEYLSKYGFYLPSGLNLTQSQLYKVKKSVFKICKKITK